MVSPTIDARAVAMAVSVSGTDFRLHRESARSRRKVGRHTLQTSGLVPRPQHCAASCGPGRGGCECGSKVWLVTLRRPSLDFTR